MAIATTFRGAHPCRVLVAAFRRNELLLGLINMRRLQTTKKVREGETPSPARETRALPRIVRPIRKSAH
jgi:hypothetical protein